MFPSHVLAHVMLGVPKLAYQGVRGKERAPKEDYKLWRMLVNRRGAANAFSEFLRQRDFPIHAATGWATLPPELCLACYLQAAGRYSGGTVPFTISGNPFSGSLLSLQIHFWPVAVANTRVLPIPPSIKPGLTPLLLNFAVT